jgi:large subunit ribosomal protein L25
MNELDINCLPGDLPEYLEVDLSTVEVGQSVHVSSIKLPKGVTVVLHGQEDLTVATASVPAGQVAAEEAAAADAAAAEKK